MKQLLVLPTWILVNLATPFLPRTHKWSGKKFTLKNWANHSTETNNMFSVFFWIWKIGLVILFIIK